MTAAVMSVQSNRSLLGSFSLNLSEQGTKGSSSLPSSSCCFEEQKRHCCQWHAELCWQEEPGGAVQRQVGGRWIERKISRNKAGGSQGWQAEMDVGSARVCIPPLLHFSRGRMKIRPRSKGLDNIKAQ